MAEKKPNPLYRGMMAGTAIAMLTGSVIAVGPAIADDTTPTPPSAATGTVNDSQADQNQKTRLDQLAADTTWWLDDSGYDLAGQRATLEETRQQLDTLRQDSQLTASQAQQAIETAATRLAAIPASLPAMQPLREKLSQYDKDSEHADRYTAATWNAYTQAKQEATAFLGSARPVKAEIQEHVNRLTVAHDNLTWAQDTEYRIGDTPLTVTGGTVTGIIRLDGDTLPDTLTVTSPRFGDITIPLDKPTVSWRQDDTTLGVGTTTGHYDYTYDDGTDSPIRRVSFHVTATVTHGTPVTGRLDDGKPFQFTRTADGMWEALTSAQLGNQTNLDNWNGGTVTLTDGTTLTQTNVSDVTVNQAPDVNGVPDQSGWQTRGRTITYTGTDRNGTPVRVQVKATRIYDPSLNLKLQRTSVDGTTSTIWDSGTVNSLNLKDTGLKALPYGMLGDKYVLTAGNLNTAANNVRDVTITPRLAGNGTRAWTVSYTVNRIGEHGALTPTTRTITVTQPFDPAPANKPNGQAKLTGFLVNGQPMAGFDANRTDYTLHAKNGERMIVTPQAASDVTVTTGPSRQTAYTTVQTWLVTGPDGATSTYTVTLVREHDKPTADEAFQPGEPHAGFTDEKNPSLDNTKLYSVGYMLDGKYTPAGKNMFDIPEGGVLAWQAYPGQTVEANGTRVSGMTWKYTIGVLAADQQTYGTGDVTVTFITQATSKAVLDGVKVDGKPINGFNPASHEYEIRVANPDKYTVTPLFDTDSGMSVQVEKTSTLATITVVSADGRVKTVYKLHVAKQSGLDAVKTLLQGDSAELAATGSPILIVTIVAVAAVFAGLTGVGYMLLRRKHGTDHADM